MKLRRKFMYYNLQGVKRSLSQCLWSIHLQAAGSNRQVEKGCRRGGGDVRRVANPGQYVLRTPTKMNP